MKILFTFFLIFFLPQKGEAFNKNNIKAKTPRVSGSNSKKSVKSSTTGNIKRKSRNYKAASSAVDNKIVGATGVHGFNFELSIGGVTVSITEGKSSIKMSSLGALGDVGAHKGDKPEGKMPKKGTLGELGDVGANMTDKNKLTRANSNIKGLELKINKIIQNNFELDVAELKQLIKIEMNKFNKIQ